MKPQLDMDKIAKGLGAKRRGKVAVATGYFGAMQLLSDIEARFRVPAGGGRATDPTWTERRLVPLAPQTLRKLERMSAKVRKQGTNVDPMQLAALLLEKTAEHLGDEDNTESSTVNRSALKKNS
jgi:hypothetical protein